MIEKLPARQHFGFTEASQTFRNFAISTVRYASHSTTPPHTNENALLGFVLNGAYSKDVGRKNKLYLESGSFFFIGAGQYQADDFGPTTDCLLVDCTPAFIGRLPIGKERTISLLDSEFISLQAQIRKELKRGDAFCEILCESIVLRALGTAARRCQDVKRPKCPVWLLEFRNALEAHSHEPLRIGDVAEQMDVHPIHAHQVFKRFFKCTPGEFVRRKRIELAMNQLAHTELSVDAIAYASGFCDRSHLARIFTRAVGMSPAEYRGLASKTGTQLGSRTAANGVKNS